MANRLGGLSIMVYNTRLGGSTCHQMLKSGDPGLGAPPSNLHQEGRVGIWPSDIYIDRWTVCDLFTWNARCIYMSGGRWPAGQPWESMWFTQSAGSYFIQTKEEIVPMCILQWKTIKTQMSCQKKKCSLCQNFSLRRLRRVFGNSNSTSSLKSSCLSTWATTTSAARSFRLRLFHFLFLSTFASVKRLAMSSWCHLHGKKFSWTIFCLKLYLLARTSRPTTSCPPSVS